MLVKAAISNTIITADIIASDGPLSVARHVGPLYCVQNFGIAPGSLLILQDATPPYVVSVLGAFASYALVAVDIERLKPHLSWLTLADAGPNLTAVWSRRIPPDELRNVISRKWPNKILVCEASKVDIRRFAMVSVGDHRQD
jgi:hypothetical protein